MKWHALPGPARYIEEVVRHLREGTHVIVAASELAPSLAQTFVEHLAHDRWYQLRVSVDLSDEPLRCLTENLYLEPEQWVGWSVERLFSNMPTNHVIVVDGVTAASWDKWRIFLQDFEAISRQKASDERSILLVFVRGVSKKRLQKQSAALATIIWSDVLGELDTLTYVDQRLRSKQKPTRHHKLIVRQIAALALWDLELADYLVDQPDRDVFDIQAVLTSARIALGQNGKVMGGRWEDGGMDYFDGIELSHPFSLMDAGDPSGELARRVWAAQASELLPLIEVRRRELVRSLERHISCPFWIDSKRQVRSLEELEIGSLAYATQTHKLQGELRDRAEWLARCRNTLAHLRLLQDADALDSRLHG